MQDISYYTLGDVLDMAEFARRGRKRGARDKKPRKRRALMAGGALAAAGVAGGSYRYGMAGYRGILGNQAMANKKGLSRMFGPKAVGTGEAFRRGATGQAVSDAGTVRNSATAMGRGINARSRKAVGTINNSARSVGGMLKGRKGLALAGAGAIAATAAGGIYGVARSRRRRR